MQVHRQFDHLYVISDLHMGGRTARRQIFNQGPLLKKFISHLQKVEPDSQVGLVLNGDTVDFLAEPNAKHFELSPQEGVGKLTRIMNDPSFACVWEALRSFVQTENRHLVITLGNHDLELTLPWVRQALLDRLTGGDQMASTRVTLELDGYGYFCAVGDSKVLCVHGNEVDEWNWTDYEMLRRIARNMTHGRDMAYYQKWIPNAGTQLVIDVMNGIKARFPFVDLLKPEEAAAVPILKALVKDDRISRVMDGLAAFANSKLDKLTQPRRLLSAADSSDHEVAIDDHLQLMSSQQLIAPVLRHSRELQVQQHADRMLDQVETRMRSGQDAFDVVSLEDQKEQLGFFGDAWKKYARGLSDVEILRQALEENRDDAVFLPDYEDATFKAMDRIVGSNIDYLVTGHTHFRRAHPGKTGPRFYFNSGTWVRLIRLTAEMLQDEAAFAPIFEVLQQDMHALDAFDDLVMELPTAVYFRHQDGQTFGELQQATETGNNKRLKMVPLENTRFP